MKDEEIREILEKLQKKVSSMVENDYHTTCSSIPDLEYDYRKFRNTIEIMLDEVLTDRQVSKLIVLVNKF